MSPALVSAIVQWYRDEALDLPWRREGFSAWGSLVSEFMLQQTPVARVLPRLEQWLQRWPTPADLAADDPAEAVRAWDNLGYPRRALWLHRAAVQIVERHGGAVPSDVDDLLALTGVGDYTARAVAAFAYGLRHPVVDTNTRRVIARAVLGQAEPGPPARRDLDDMAELLPLDEVDAHDFNAGIMELGQRICSARSPGCAICPVEAHCAWIAAGRPAYLGPRKAVQKKYEGSDRQVRGLILRALRESAGEVAESELAALWTSDAAQYARARASLVRDGLAVETERGLSLASSSAPSVTP